MARMGRGGERGPWTHWLGEDRKTEMEGGGDYHVGPELCKEMHGGASRATLACPFSPITSPSPHSRAGVKGAESPRFP